MWQVRLPPALRQTSQNAKLVIKKWSKICTLPHKDVNLQPLSCRPLAVQVKGWFGSSVGLEQQPSKLRVKGSSPFRITEFKDIIVWYKPVMPPKREKEDYSPFFLVYMSNVSLRTVQAFPSLHSYALHPVCGLPSDCFQANSSRKAAGLFHL